MKKKIDWYEGIGPLQEALSTNGAFLVTRDETGRPNAMTIGWGQIGIVWSRPVSTRASAARIASPSTSLHLGSFQASLSSAGRSPAAT